ncbi:uncharacterized protein LOC127257203 [Andrographis paniculata]|uniref:uncharacterized protein LOC127257203 n=1 Tax=Andrographis paniculata TaxID=175694 RepID=UPI0021E79ED7|nr:uncharacterized protein LOC127257203 [Andrographis paniculata]
MMIMDRDEQELKSMGLLGIYKESYRLIFRFPKIFTQITLTLILPLSIIFLSHNQVSNILHRRIIHVSTTADDVVSSPLTVYILIKATYFTFLLVFSLLATSAVVYTVACIYTSGDVAAVAFRAVVTAVVPTVWKRLIITFLCTFFVFCTYNFVFLVTLFSVFLFFATFSDNFLVGQAVVYLVLAAYGFGFVYMSVVWQVAGVVTVLEESYGFAAMVRSKGLINAGGMTASLTVIFLTLNAPLAVIGGFFKEFVEDEDYYYFGVVTRIGIGALCLVALMKVILLGLVVQTVVYFVCKAKAAAAGHNGGGAAFGNLDLADRLEGYLGEYYVPLKAKDVVLEEFRV